MSRECVVYRRLGRQPTALHHARGLCLHHGRYGRQTVYPGSAHWRSPRLDRARHVCHQWGQTSSQCQQSQIGHARRFATVAPVFGNLRGNKRSHRFTLRGKAKADGQWKLYYLMHNIEKLANHGYTQ
ncbi:transposase [Chitinivorax sp. B]|uniref:transposase n=1 Tax=Chitinivorax sp. B TaxID=2502235 RepID=UPI0020172083|nr:transposase [Chitinivorax sp. B]